MIYAFYAPLQLLCMVLCYLTNWIVVLTGTEDGQLPWLFHLWNTWDDTLDNRTDIERMPKFLQYDWDEHYHSYTTQLNGRTIYRETLIKPFDLKDRVKRYCCRAHWLYRNCAYGFAYYLFGTNVVPPFKLYGDDTCYFAVASNGPWALKCTRPITRKFRFEIYLGWKIQRKITVSHRAMIACRLWVKAN